jgi:hypothetical protein
MSWTTKLKEIAQEHTLKGVLALLLLLLGVIWSAIPSEVWGKISAAIPKPVLWAVIGVLTVVTILESASIYISRKRLKRLRQTTKLFPNFGVLWDELNNPHCPSCKNLLPQKLKERYGYDFAESKLIATNPLPTLECLQCNKEITLIDDDGEVITLKNAKQQLSLLRTT